MKKVCLERQVKQRIGERTLSTALESTCISYNYDPGGFLRTAARFMMDEHALFYSDKDTLSSHSVEGVYSESSVGFCEVKSLSSISQDMGDIRPKKRPLFDYGPISLIKDTEEESKESDQLHCVTGTSNLQKDEMDTFDLEPIPLFRQVEQAPVFAKVQRTGAAAETRSSAVVIQCAISSERNRPSLQCLATPFDGSQGVLASTGSASILAEIRKRSVPNDWPLESRLYIARYSYTTNQQGGTTVCDKTPKLLKPLNAYNYFFRAERDNLVHGSVDGVFPAAVSDRSNAKMWDLLHERWWVDPFKAKRKHRKKEGTVPFATLGREISKRWLALSPNEQEFYYEIAKADAAQYEFTAKIATGSDSKCSSND